ncbi:hypothetical protein BDU57DRAFT_456908 [Ampelomyces quisqualis]|uniref:4'-phosphopantetheinyl transferase domain-containing protein n=1 Tax=Ampelomyces quisqualis TaxID=50730 RepID=A0A6A5QEQ8_AMPQU|nr:hypothetical protein BDU57DRAFT_456908 [Ampelomyces quisqualis]
MAPRLFPHALRVGTDICNISRVRRLITRKGDDLSFLNRFTKRVLTEPECIYFWERFGPHRDIHLKLDNVSEFLAGRFAAKEAIRKACNLGQLERGLQSIMILPVTSSPPAECQSSRPQGLVLDNPYVSTPAAGRVRKKREPATPNDELLPTSVDHLDGQLCEISISHDGDFATAVALVPNTEH